MHGRDEFAVLVQGRQQTRAAREGHLATRARARATAGVRILVGANVLQVELGLQEVWVRRVGDQLLHFQLHGVEHLLIGASFLNPPVCLLHHILRYG